MIAGRRVDSPDELRKRTADFAVRIVKLARVVSRSLEGRVPGGQVLRSGTSVAANYRAACRARSRAEFVAKLGVTVEEADETVFWLELLGESGVVAKTRLEPLVREANELLFIMSASRKTAKLSITTSPDRQIAKCSACS